MEKPQPTREELIDKIRTLEERLWEAEQTIEAIRSGEVDALIVHKPDGEHLYTLTGADYGYRVLVESITEGALILSSDESIYYCNRTLAEMLEIPIQKIIGTKLDSYVASTGREHLMALIRDSRRRGAAKGELLMKRNDGTLLPTTVSLNRMSFEDFEGVCAVVTDLSGQKHVEEELRRHRTELESLVNERTIDLARTNAKLQQEVIERKQIEETLRESEERLRLFIEYAPASLAMFDRQMRYLSFSRRWLSDYNLGGRDLTGLSHYEVFQEIPEYWKSVHQRGLAGEVVRADNDRFERADGSVQSLCWEVRPWYNAVGEVGGIVIFTEDISGPMRAEEKLRQSERHFRALAEALPQIVWTAGADGGVEWLNQRWYDYTGEPEGAGVGWSWEKGVHPDDLARTLENWQEARERGALFQNEIQIRQHDGQYRWFLARAWPLQDADGNVVRWFGTHTDIHEMKASEASLRQSQIDQSRAQEVGQIGSWRLDVRRNVLEWSDQNYRIFGVPRGTSLTYESFLEIVHPDDREYVDTQWMAGLRGEPYDIEHRIVANGRVKWVSEKAYLEFDEAGNLLGGFGITQDITKRKRAEEELRESEEHLRTSLAEKEVLLKEIHHRVKNNMQVISSLVALQADELEDGALRAVLQEVTHRVHSMAMVHEKLYQSADLARIDFAKYAQSLLNYLWRAHGTVASGIRLSLDLEPVLLSVNAAVPCGLILNELVSNALKHAFHDRAGGEVAVTLRGGAEGRVYLCVCDNGTGLPAGFDWSQARSLGLRLVRMLAGQLHAVVEVSIGEGTGFTVTFGGPKR